MESEVFKSKLAPGQAIQVQWNLNNNDGTISSVWWKAVYAKNVRCVSYDSMKDIRCSGSSMFVHVYKHSYNPSCPIIITL